MNWPGRRFLELVQRDGPWVALQATNATLSQRSRRLLRSTALRTVGLYRSRVAHRRHPLRYSDACPFKLVSVDPTAVTAIQQPCEHPRIETDELGRFHKFKNIGKVVGEEWDRSTIGWEEFAFVDGFEDHFVHGVPWNETEFFQHIVSERDDWTQRWDDSRWDSFSTESEAMRELRSFDELFDAIQTNGYRRTELFDELTLNIGRDGQLIHNNSASHRLCLARILDIDRVPARVLIRHRRWQSVRNDLKGSGSSVGVDEHPDLMDVK